MSTTCVLDVNDTGNISRLSARDQENQPDIKGLQLDITYLCRILSESSKDASRLIVKVGMQHSYYHGSAKLNQHAKDQAFAILNIL